jgi:hypothetical protein
LQTFLPHPNFKECSKILDMKRLCKQRLEAYQLLNGRLGKTKNGWRHHPASKMWAGYEISLAQYMNCMIQEWINRGFNNTMKLSDLPDKEVVVYPPWLGNNKYHSAYRAILLAKDYEYYSKFGWKETPNIAVWPYPVPRLSRR